MKTPLIKKILFLLFFAVSSASQASDGNSYLSCLRQSNPPAENRTNNSWLYEEIEIHPPEKTPTGAWNLVVASGYVQVTDIGSVNASSFDVMVYGVNDPYEVVADKTDVFGRLKGQLKNGKWQVQFLARGWKVAETLNCRLFDGPGTFKPAE